MTTEGNCTTQRAPTALFRLDSRLTLHQARGRLISELMRSYDAAQLAYKLWELDPDVPIRNGATSRSLAGKIAWRLLPGGPKR